MFLCCPSNLLAALLLVDSQRAAVEFHPVEAFDRPLGRARIVEFRETEAPRSARLTIVDHPEVSQIPHLLQHVAQLIFGHVPRNVSNEDARRHVVSVTGRDVKLTNAGTETSTRASTEFEKRTV
mgnify:CR=1 FL=1